LSVRQKPWNSKEYKARLGRASNRHRGDEEFAGDSAIWLTARAKGGLPSVARSR
jgi:hypothetical protein